MGKTILAIAGLWLALAGLGSGAEFTRQVRHGLDRMDRGEAVTQADDPIGYGDMDSDQRAAMRLGVDGAEQVVTAR